MANKDYYLILGVSRAETPAGIRDAFRELAKIYHPDRVGPESTQKFQEIAEAYEVLSDPASRKRYNDTLPEAADRTMAERAEPIAPRPKRQPEPLVPSPMSILYDFETIRPSFNALFDLMLRNFTGIDVPKSERIEGLNIEVLLSPLEAARGALAPIGVPVFHTCGLCHGSGQNWLLPCTACGGQGMIEREATVSVRIPAMVRDRTVIEVPIEGLGVRNFCLRLHVRVST